MAGWGSLPPCLLCQVPARRCACCAALGAVCSPRWGQSSHAAAVPRSGADQPLAKGSERLTKAQGPSFSPLQMSTEMRFNQLRRLWRGCLCFSVFSMLIFILKMRAIPILCWGDPTHQGVLGPQNEGCLRSRAPTWSGGNYFHIRLSLGCCWYVQTSDSALALIKTMSVASCLPHELHFRLIRRLASCHGALDTGASYKDLK